VQDSPIQSVVIALNRDLDTEQIIGKVLNSRVEFVSFSDRKDFNRVTCAWVDMTIVLNDEFLELFPNLRFIATPTTGLTHLDLESIRRRRIEILSLKGEKEFLESITATSELAWTLALAVWRKIIPASTEYEDSISIRKKFGSFQLKGLTIGLIGFGRLGKHIHKFAKAFDMKTIFFDPFIDLDSLDIVGNLQVTESISELCSRSDIIFLVASHEEGHVSDYPIVKKEHLDRVKKSAILINVSRGSLVDEAELVKKIRNGSISGIGIDVLAREESATQSMDLDEIQKLQREGFNVIVTPHIGGMCWDALSATQRFVAQKLMKALEEHKGSSAFSD
jgi:D-3-phosphoglycerate dehydrogenase